jgi:hypothetical protein
MNFIASQLRRFAEDWARQPAGSEAPRQTERTGREDKTALKKEPFERAETAQGRLSNYQPVTGTDYQCPRCWIDRATASPLRPVPHTTLEQVFRCGICQHEIGIHISK